MSVNLDKVRGKIEAALRLSQNNTNEAEAMAALSKAQEMATRYGLSLDDITNKSEASERYEARHNASFGKGNLFNFVDRKLSYDIARFCAVKIGTSYDDDGNVRVDYFGHEVDVELAMYLRLTLLKAMDQGWMVYRNFATLPPNSHMGHLKKSWCSGFCDRIRERMSFLQRAAPAGGTALITLKNQLLVQKAREHGFEEARGRASYQTAVNPAAYGAGQVAGNTANLGRGVHGGGNIARIGKS